MLKCIQMVLDSKNLDHIWKAAEVMCLFCKQHSGAIAVISEEIIDMYNDLISEFSKFLVTAETDKARKLQCQTIGLKVVYAVIKCQDTYTDETREKLNQVVYSLLESILSNNKGKYALEESKERAADDTLGLIEINEEDIEYVEQVKQEEVIDSEKQDQIIARIEMAKWGALRRLTKLAYGSNLRYVILAVFKFIDSCPDHWAYPNYGKELMGFLARQLQPQYQNIVITELLLCLGRLTGKRSKKNDQKQYCLVAILRYLLQGPVVLEGVSVLEVLAVLVSILMSEVGTGTIKSRTHVNDVEKTEENGAVRRRLIEELEECIAVLVKRKYYANQTCDILTTLVGHIKIESKGNMGKLKNSTHQKNMSLLRAIKKALINLEGGVQENRFGIQGDVNAWSWTPIATICMLLPEADDEMKLLIGQIACLALKASSTKKDKTKERHTHRRYTLTAERGKGIDRVISTMLTLLTNQNRASNYNYYVSSYFLKYALKYCPGYRFIVLKALSLIYNGRTITQKSHEVQFYCIQTVYSIYIKALAEKCKKRTSELSNYIESTISSQKSRSCWVDLIEERMDTDIKCWPGPKNNDKFNTSFTEGSGKLVTGSANDQQNSDLWDSALLAGLFIGSNPTISKRYLETLKSMQTVDAEGTEASIDAVLTSLLYCSAEDNGENLADEKDELLPVTSGFVSEDRRVDTELDLKDYELGNDSENIVMEKTMLNSELFDSRPSLSVLDTSDLLKAGEKAIMLDPVLPELKLRGLPNVFPSPIMASVLPYMTQNPPKNSISTGSHHNNTFVEPLSYANKDENEKNSEKNLASGSKNPSERSKATMDFSALVYQDLSEGFSNVLANSVGYSNDDGTKNMQYEKQLNQGLVSYDIHSDESFNRGFSDNLNVAHFKKVLSSGFADVNTMLMNKDANVTAVHFDENNSSVKANSRSNVVNGNSKSSSQSAVGTQLYSLSQGNALVESSSSDEDDDQSFDIHDRDYYNSSNKADHVFSYLKI